MDWKFAKKWGLRSGVLYNLYTPQEKYRPVASVQSEAYTSNVDGNVIVFDVVTGQVLSGISGNNFYADSLSGNVIIPVNRLQRLEVPVTAFWQAARPLKIFGGLSLMRTLAAKSDKQNYSGDYVLKLADRTAEDGASKLSSTELDNWSADAMLGFGVHFGRSFELGMSAKMPLIKFSGLTKSDENATLNTNLRSDTVGAARKKSGSFLTLYGILFF